jgi:hypothetical protein
MIPAPAVLKYCLGFTRRRRPGLIVRNNKLMMPRRKVIVAALAMPHIAEAGMLFNSFLTGVGTPNGFPGTSGNPVGYAAAPGYPGILTPHGTTGWVSGSAGSPNTYSYLDINAGNRGVSFGSGANWITFIGCRFQSNQSGNYNVAVQGGTNLTFRYCSFVPLVSSYREPPGAAWPSAGAGQQTTTQTDNVNCITGMSGYDYGLNILSGGPVTMDHCDWWGFGNGGPLFYATTAQMIVDNCWIHDACNALPLGFHQDGTGYLNADTCPSNVTVRNCTIASIGNTQAISFSESTTIYRNISVIGNFVSGYGFCCNFFLGGGLEQAQNCKVTGNIWGTDIAWRYGPIYRNPTSVFQRNGNVWSGNTLSVLRGTSPLSGSAFSFTETDSGKFLWPDSTLHTKDFVP